MTSITIKITERPNNGLHIEALIPPSDTSTPKERAVALAIRDILQAEVPKFYKKGQATIHSVEYDPE